MSNELAKKIYSKKIKDNTSKSAKVATLPTTASNSGAIYASTAIPANQDNTTDSFRSSFSSVFQRIQEINTFDTDIIFYGIVLSSLQFLDGLITYAGIIRAGGTFVEGNPILRSAMDLYGTYPTLITVKFLSFFIIAFICSQSNKVWWVKPSLSLLIVFYLFAALVPWVLALG